jgi:hypothetical protein
VIAVVLTALGGRADSAQDKYTLQVPNGLAFSDFKGYEDWQVVAVNQTDDLLKVMVANPAMIAAYRAGAPGNLTSSAPAAFRVRVWQITSGGRRATWEATAACPRANVDYPPIKDGAGRQGSRLPRSHVP